MARLPWNALRGNVTIRKIRKRVYLRIYQIRFREHVTEQHRKYRKKKWPIIRIQSWVRARYKRLTRKEEVHQYDRRNMLSKTYGLTVADYERMLAEQGGLCAICRQPERRRKRKRYLCIDHDHATGVIRGLLCHGCNAGLGHARDDVDVLRAMIAYLERKKDPSTELGSGPRAMGRITLREQVGDRCKASPAV